MRDRTSPGLWKIVALTALSGCGLLLLRTPRVVATQADEARAASDEEDAASSRSPDGDRSLPREAQSTSQLLATLQRATSVRARCNALMRLSRVADLSDQAVARMASYGDSKYLPELRSCAASALGATAASAALPYLLELVEDTDYQVREAVVRALVQREDDESREAVLGLIKTGPRALRVALAVALAETGSLQATPFLGELLEGAGSPDRERLINALGASGDPAALDLLQKLVTSGGRPTQYAAIAALGELGSQGAVRTLLSLLDSQPSLLAFTTQALARTGDESAVAALIELSDGQHGTTAAQSAMQALCSVDDPAVHELMLTALRSPLPNTSQLALQYFSQHTDAEAGPVLMELVEEGSPRTLYSALQALARLDDPAGRALIEKIASGTSSTREAALGALMQTPDGSARAREIALAQVRRGGPQIYQALDLVSNDGSPEARAAMLDLVKRGEPSSAPQAMMWLGQQTDPESRRMLEELAASEKVPEQQRSAALFALAQTGDGRVVKTLRAALQTESPSLRAQAVNALSQLSGPDAEQALLNASRDKSGEVAANAASALGQIASPAALGRLEEMARAKDPQVARQATMMLAQSSPERAAPLVESLLHAQDPESRQLAINMAGMLSSEAGSRVLLSGVRDRDPNVVRSALANVASVGLEAPETQAALHDVAQNQQLPEDLRTQATQLLTGQGVGRMLRVD